MSTTPADTADIVENRCGLCGFPIHLSEGGLRHFGYYTAHSEYRCRDIMLAEIEALRARVNELQRKLDAAVKAMANARRILAFQPHPLTSAHADEKRAALAAIDTTIASIRGEG